MTINICGIPYTVIDLDDNFSADAKHFGQADFLKARIILNKYLAEPIKQETLVHEIVHAILVHIGRPDLSEDETFVQSLEGRYEQCLLELVYHGMRCHVPTELRLTLYLKMYGLL